MSDKLEKCPACNHPLTWEKMPGQDDTFTAKCPNCNIPYKTKDFSILNFSLNDSVDDAVAIQILAQFITHNIRLMLKDEECKGNRNEIITRTVLEYVGEVKTLDDIKDKLPTDADKERIIQLFHEVEQEANTCISVGARKPELIFQPADKVSYTLFDCLGSGTHALAAEKKGAKTEITTYLTVDFEELSKETALTFKQLTPYECRVYTAAGALLEAGNNYISPTQIYAAMGGKGRPAQYQITNIVKACIAMMGIRIKIDNKEESEKYNYPEYKRGLFYLFPVEIAENVKINGKTTDFCLHFLKDQLPLIEFAKARKQIEKFTPEQWALPFSMTEDNLTLDYYLRHRIRQIRTERGGKILFKTIYDRCDIDTSVKKTRAAKKIRTLLDHYRDTGLIKSYKENADGITLTV